MPEINPLDRDPTGSGRSPEPVGRWTVEPDAKALGVLRAEVRSRAETWGLLEDDLDVLMLIVSELVSNAIEHARTASVVIVRRLTLMVRVIVIDGSSAPPLLQPYDVTAPRGRGLQMVDELSRTVGLGAPLPRQDGVGFCGADEGSPAPLAWAAPAGD
jgi:anti-sigma regulatory factor (Ser/Thr protein kinase)